MENIENTKPRIPMSLGQKRIRVDYNSEDQDYITLSKKKAAKLIDFIDQSKAESSWPEETVKEWQRLKALALTSIEEASSWATKAATIQP